jgi:alcohol dehydrogenase
LTEYKAINQESLVRFPDHLSYEEAATLPCAALTAWSALREGTPVGPGQTVLTLGTGGVALFALQLAKLSGARVVATTSNDSKAQVLRDLGADHVINYQETPSWGAQAKHWTGGRGVDRVIEVGGAGTLPQSMQAITPAGEIAVIGFLASPHGSTLDFNDLFLSGATFRVLSVGHRGALMDLTAAVGQARLNPVIDSVHSFDAAIEAYRRLASGAAVGKIVISI